MTKRKNKQPQRPKAKPSQTPEQLRDEKVLRLAHHILTKTIDSANLKLEEAIDVLAIVAQGLVISNTSDEDLEERSEMIAWIEDRFSERLDVIDPLDQPAHAWIVPPQGSITEAVGILWTGSLEETNEVQVQVVLGAELDVLRAEISENPDEVIVTEGVEGLAVVDPTWDGEPTMTCANPQCGKVHDVHLVVAENLFQQAVERRRQGASSN